MQTGALTSYLDVAQLTLYAFWVFFIGLIWYLRQEDKREGYPLISDRPESPILEGIPPMPAPKTFLLRGGGTYQAPPGTIERRPIAAEPQEIWPGAALEPTGDPLRDQVGPASYAERHDTPDLTAEGEPMIVPLRVAKGFYVEPRDPDPRGMTVIAADGETAGKVTDIWVDRSEPQIRFLEVDVAAGGGTKLLPIYYARIDGKRRQVKVKALLARQFADVPGIASPDQITLREEDRILGFFGGGHLYAEPSRMEPVI